MAILPIVDNTDDELSYAAFINTYLKAHGAKQVNLDRFRTLPGSTSSRPGADQQDRPCVGQSCWVPQAVPCSSRATTGVAVSSRMPSTATAPRRKKTAAATKTA